MRRKCQCCEKIFPEEELTIASSGLGAFSFAYCTKCLNDYAEPYWLVVSIAAFCDDEFNYDNEAFLNHWRQRYEYWGKTDEEFLNDVKKEIAAFEKLEKEMEEESKWDSIME